MFIDDAIIAQAQKQLAHAVWVPEQTLVVVGNSNDVATECYEDRCLNDGIPVLRRYGGGGAVVLHKGCVIVSIGCWMRDMFSNNAYFRLLNEALIRTLGTLDHGLARAEQRGISDLCLGDRKIAGTSLFRSRNYLLYQASILVDAYPEQIEKYLRHPSREPDYRAQRPHRAFIAGIREFCPALTPQQMMQHLQRQLPTALEILTEHCIAPPMEQIQSVLDRPSRALK